MLRMIDGMAADEDTDLDSPFPSCLSFWLLACASIFGREGKHIIAEQACGMPLGV